jgi:PhzF family phenazine biosynthesis protein
MKVVRVAAFADGQEGGNPAGVVVCRDELPSAEAMQAVAAELGYSETAFAAPSGPGQRWRVRYFAPEVEVDFCGHATIALGATLAKRHGDGVFELKLNRARITVEGRRDGPMMLAALQSPPPHSRPVPAGLVADALALFSLDQGDLDHRILPAVAHAGADHLVLALGTRARLAAMRYELETGRALALAHGIGTFSLVHAEAARLFHARNPFPIGGMYEDPATGAAAAALAGYLRDLGWPHGGGIEIVQGEDMGMRSRLHATIPPAQGASIRVSGSVRPIALGRPRGERPEAVQA